MNTRKRREYNRLWMRRARRQGRFLWVRKKPDLVTVISSLERKRLLAMDPKEALVEFHRMNLSSGRGETAALYGKLQGMKRRSVKR